jgi:hypothetical protein
MTQISPMRTSLLAPVLFVAAACVQPAPPSDIPPVVLARVDGAPAGETMTPDTAGRFVRMPPGWHINPGPGLILFDSATDASGLFSVEAVIHTFPADSTQGPVGLIFGGSRMTSDSVSHMLFLIRPDAHYGIAHRVGAELHEIVPFTGDTAIRVQSGGAPSTNRIRVTVRADSVVFLINDRRMAALPAGGMMVTTGAVGVRVGEQANVHISTLDVIRHLAPSVR